MRVTVTCNACGKSFQVDAQYAGKKGRCPNAACRETYIVPSPKSEFDDDEQTEDILPRKKSKSRADSDDELPVATKSAKGKGKKTTPNRQFHLISFGVGVAITAVLGLMLFIALPRGSRASSEANGGSSASKFQSQALPILKKYCAECHSGDAAEGNFSLAKYTDDKSILKDRKRWERLTDLVTSGEMPPADSKKPTPAEKQLLLDYLETTLFKIDCSQGVDPGRVTIRRLNRNEYNNTIRDLVGVDVHPANDFPSDDVGYGFDNIGDVLSLPPLLMEKYLDAAELVARTAIVTNDPTKIPVLKVPGYQLKFDKKFANRDGEEGLVLFTNGEVSLPYEAKSAGKYLLRVRAAEQPAGNEAAKMQFSLDGKKLQEVEVKAREGKPEFYELPVILAPGKHTLSAAFTNDFADEKAKDPKRRDRNLLIGRVELKGPLEIDPASYPPSHRRFIAQTPANKDPATISAAAKANLEPFLKRAFRRPVTDAEVQKFVGIVNRATQAGESFEFGMQVALQGVLVSPHFLFRVENDRNPLDPNDKHNLGQYELASRLSYFLWSSLPDAELFQHAEAGDLHTDAVLDAQVLRLLKDPRSEALVTNFAEQWLQLRVLDEITPDPQKFPKFDDALREDMKQETRRFFEYVMREDRSVLEFLDGPYTFVNQRLAEHYGMKNVKPKGKEFTFVSLEGSPRAGLLTHASILTMTSNPNRTSPVKRGKWIMETILDTPPPPPPANVPELEETQKSAPNLSLRKQLEQHRGNAACASCHRVMDTLGFGFENFDPIGRWRETDNGLPLDVAGTLPGGESFNGPRELSGILRTQKVCNFTDCLAERMLTYALGRGLEFYDRCTVNKITTSMRRHEYKFSALILAVVHSDSFRMRRGEETP